MKKLATLVAGVLLVSGMAFAGSAVEVKSADGTATLRVGGQVGGNFSATLSSVKPKTGDAVGSTTAKFDKESDYQLKIKLNKTVGNFEAQVSIAQSTVPNMEDTYIKYKLNDATSVKYQYKGDVVKLGDHWNTVTVPAIDGLSAELKSSDALTIKAGLAFAGISDAIGDHIGYGLRGGVEMKSGADTTIIAEAAGTNVGADKDKTIIGVSGRVATKLGTAGLNGEVHFATAGKANDDYSSIYVYGKYNPAPIRIEAEVKLNDGAKDVTTMAIIPGIESDIGNGLIAFAEAKVQMTSIKDVKDTTSITPKVAMKYEF